MIKIHEDNPFKTLITRMHAQARRSSQSARARVGKQDVDITISKDYLPVLFARVAQYRDALLELSPEACKLAMYVMVTLGYDEQTIHIRRKDVGMSARVFSRGMVELMGAQIIAAVQHKRELYWVNLGIICVGSIERAEHQSPLP